MNDYQSLRVALYARVAVPHPSGPGPLADQIAVLRQHIAASGSFIAPEFEFVDNGYSGAGLQRPALERLRRRAAQGTLNRLYVAAPDRLTRRAAHYFLLLKEFRDAGVEVIFGDANAAV